MNVVRVGVREDSAFNGLLKIKMSRNGVKS
jgi:hypothetical protein